MDSVVCIIIRSYWNTNNMAQRGCSKVGTDTGCQIGYMGISRMKKGAIRLRTCRSLNHGEDLVVVFNLDTSSLAGGDIAVQPKVRPHEIMVDAQSC